MLRKYQDERREFEDRLAKKEELIKRLEEGNKNDSILQTCTKITSRIEEYLCGELGIEFEEKFDLVHRLEQLKRTVERYSEHQNKRTGSLKEKIAAKQSEIGALEEQVEAQKTSFRGLEAELASLKTLKQDGEKLAADKLSLKEKEICALNEHIKGQDTMVDDLNKIVE